VEFPVNNDNFLFLPFEVNERKSENNNLCCRLGTPFALYCSQSEEILPALKQQENEKKHGGDGIIIIIYFYCRLQALFSESYR
jgi:hypothetical protein